MAVGDIHNREGRLERTKERIILSDEISEHNTQVLKDFHKYLRSQDLSSDRQCRYLYNWYQLMHDVDWELEETDKEQLQDLVERIHQTELSGLEERDKDLSEHTKAEYKKAIRKMFTDYFEDKVHKFDSLDKGYDGEEMCSFFSLTTEAEKLDREELPTPQTAKKFIREADRMRDKALIAVLWSSAGRIGEILGLKWKDIRFDKRKGEEIAKIKFRDTKNGGSRKVPLRVGYLYLRVLKENDSRSDEPEAFVFRNRTDDGQLSHNAACSILNRIRKRLDIPPHVKTNPHAWRKGRATDLAARGMNQATLCEFGGWVQGSEHVSRYVRLAESDVENGVKSIYGMENGEEIERDLEPVKCHECGELNKFEAENCRECGTVVKVSKLYEEAEIDEMTDELVFEIAQEEGNVTKEEIREKARELVNER